MSQTKFPTGLRFTINDVEMVVIQQKQDASFYISVECPSKDNMYLLREGELTQIAVIPAQPVIDRDYAAKADFHWSKRNKSVKFMRDLKKHLKIK